MVMVLKILVTDANSSYRDNKYLNTASKIYKSTLTP